MPDPIDENPTDDGEFTSAEEIGPVVLWPTAAIEGALADRDRLADIIDRAAELLDCYLDERPPGRAPLAIRDARAVLAEAEPGDLEGAPGASQGA